MTDKEVTIVITSCGRPELLRATLNSFVQMNTYPHITKCIIIEDSGQQGINDFTQDMNLPFALQLIYNETNIGQVESIDKAYAEVSTPWIFHCEEDWEFYRPGFIEDSMAILNQDPKLVCVWLRRYGDSPHPVEPNVINGSYRLMAGRYKEPDADRTWMGFTFNPALRRKCDYDLVKPFVECAKPYYGKIQADECDLQKVYLNHGFRAAITLNTNGYVRHIGWGEHVKRKWE